MLTIRVSSSVSSVEPSGSVSCPARIWVPTSAPSMLTSIHSGMLVASASSGDRGVLGDDQRVGGGLADEVDADVDGDLLALADGDEVDVLEGAADRVDLHLLGQRQLRRAVDVELQQRVGAAVLERDPGLVTGQRDVDRLVAVPVDDSGHLVGAADPASGALAELGAGLGLDLVGHVMALSLGRTSRSRVFPGPETKRRAPWSDGARRDGQPALSITETRAARGLPRRGNRRIVTGMGTRHQSARLTRRRR